MINIIYNKKTLLITGIVIPPNTFEYEMETNVIPNFGGVDSDYGSISLTKEEYSKTSTHEYSIVNGELVFGSEKPETLPEPSEIEIMTDYLVDVDYRVTMIELGL